jgi:hypothetical protein
LDVGTSSDNAAFYFLFSYCILYYYIIARGGRRGCDHMVVEFTTTYAPSVYHQNRCEFESLSELGVLDTTLCDKSL